MRDYGQQGDPDLSGQARHRGVSLRTCLPAGRHEPRRRIIVNRRLFMCVPTGRLRCRRTVNDEDPELTELSGSFYLIITFYFLFVDPGRNFAIGSNGNMEFIFNNETDSLASEPHLLNISCTILPPVFYRTRNG